MLQGCVNGVLDVAVGLEAVLAFATIRGVELGNLGLLERHLVVEDAVDVLVQQTDVTFLCVHCI